MYSVDCVVIGAGVVGLAVARALGQMQLETIIVERNPGIGYETSSRNSEVIHAGLYYPAGSLKAITCVRGRELLYSYCDRHGIPHRRCAKLIVATDDSQLPRLEAIQRAAGRNGVEDLRLLSEAEACELEPALRCRGALLSPSTGIVDSHEYLQSLQAQAQSCGAVFAFNCTLLEAAVVDGGVELVCGTDQTRLRTRWLVNCAGLSAVAVAERIAGFPREHVPRAFLGKGSYYSLQDRVPFSRLIYPVPEPGGLGIHLTFDLSGRARFGPDVEWVDTIAYDVDSNRSRDFYAAIRKYWPALRDGTLSPDYAGIRPKIAGPGDTAADFRIDGPNDHHVDGIVNLFGIESPGLTASLAIAERVEKIVRDK